MTYHYVLRTHSYTDRQQLWKVMSRRFAKSIDAWKYCDYLFSISDNPKHEFFVVARSVQDE